MDATPLILPYSHELAPYFLSVNRQWIEHYFFLEPFDKEQLEQPHESIIAKGGQVWFAKWQDEVVGTVAVKKVNVHTFELIKMGVLPHVRGKKIGFNLGMEALGWAKEQGADRVVLYTNSILSTAIHLYRKMGFCEVPIEPGKYRRCDVKMQVAL
ncbi:GNAT family N-acetyltransferase [Pleomorphovibrio marinus]|uniref:GNAT family N-acetyltransferase n=1 Tax=Pleomorphovibrio marinus TaxID=2164132 RepID=UPI000E0BE4EB|nr:GNAT family N-acetyltransferase [Pleomorphovibrio marinus]